MDIEQIKEITLKEYLDMLQPLHGGMALILREEWPEKLGAIYLSEKAKARSAKQSRIGVILKISSMTPYWNGGVDEDAVYRKQHLNPGMKVMFDPPNPVMAGHSIMFKTKDDYRLQLLHVSDVHCLWVGPTCWDDNEDVTAIIKGELEA